ncbi:MAG: hypothetical protein K6D38_04855 [Pseudobutyrivibrio sp.]|nr:hypothetical protein [Pseudobutyrivibrio sp.]
MSNKRLSTILFSLLATILVALFAAPISCQAKTLTQAENPKNVKYRQLNSDEIMILKVFFDCDFYRTNNDDVVDEVGTSYDALFNHFTSKGIFEGRDCCSYINVSAYSASNSDLFLAFKDNPVKYYEHYLIYGINENRYVLTLEACAARNITVVSLADSRIRITPGAFYSAKYFNTNSYNKVAENVYGNSDRKNSNGVDTATENFADNKASKMSGNGSSVVSDNTGNNDNQGKIDIQGNAGNLGDIDNQENTGNTGSTGNADSGFGNSTGDNTGSSLGNNDNNSGNNNESGGNENPGGATNPGGTTDPGDTDPVAPDPIVATVGNRQMINYYFLHGELDPSIYGAYLYPDDQNAMSLVWTSSDDYSVSGSYEPSSSNTPENCPNYLFKLIYYNEYSQLNGNETDNVYAYVVCEVGRNVVMTAEASGVVISTENDFRDFANNQYFAQENNFTREGGAITAKSETLFSASEGNILINTKFINEDVPEDNVNIDIVVQVD